MVTPNFQFVHLKENTFMETLSMFFSGRMNVQWKKRDLVEKDGWEGETRTLDQQINSLLR